RAALVSALGLAVASWLVHRLALRTLRQHAVTPRLTACLALSAALATSLGSTWQLEGTIAGGASWAAALALLGLLIRPAANSADARTWLVFGALLAATTLENHFAGLALGLALAAQLTALGEVPPRRSWALLLAGAAAVSLLCVIPRAIRPLSLEQELWLALPGSAGELSRQTGISAANTLGAEWRWLFDAGLFPLVAAAAAGVYALVLTRTRWIAAPLVTWALAGLLFASREPPLLTPDPRVAFGLLALAALAILAALALQAGAVAVTRARIPHAPTAIGALVAFYFMLVLMNAEDSSFLADRRSQHAADAWTDEALGNLPPDSALLVRSPALAMRLWAARVVRGERPDLLLVPMPALEQGALGESLVEAEPGANALVRDMAIHGHPSEYALSTLADARPLLVEFDRRFDPRLFEHLVPRPLWMSFAPQALGRSDRKAGLQAARQSFERLLPLARNPEYADYATLAVVAESLGDQALLLAMLGDRDAVRTLLPALQEIAPAHPHLSEIEERLHGRRSVRTARLGPQNR
ncbi:MAG TPA: hypothetical protein VK509_08110, partial [Polyangiales bacterium]|nr:hypothetical protein [Polyangiales bacterium]